MKLYDISMPIHAGMPVYKNDVSRQPRLTVNRTIEADGAASSTITLELHTGTHLDAPGHMLEGGNTIDELPLTSVLTSCRVVGLTALTGEIRPEDLAPFDIQPGEFILIKTENSYRESFETQFVFLGQRAANWLAKQGVKGVGTDGLGLERGQPGHPTHKALFKAGCVVLEGLVLRNIEPGNYKLIALPLKIIGAEASPVRAVLVEE